MKRRFVTLAILIVLTLLLLPRGFHNQQQQPDEGNLSADEELQVKMMQVSGDMLATDALCRSQCSLKLQAEAETITATTAADQDLTARLQRFQQLHPHIHKLAYLQKNTSPPSTSSDWIVQADPMLPEGVEDSIAQEWSQAISAGEAGQAYQSPAIQTASGIYFVTTAVADSGEAALTGLVHQQILSQIHDHQMKNLRVVPYPAEGNWTIESVDTDTLQDVQVDHPEENEGTSHYYINQVVVKFRQPPDQALLEQIQTEIGGRLKSSMGSTYVFESSQMETKELMSYFYKWNIEYVEPHYLYLSNSANTDGGSTRYSQQEATFIPNDTLYSRYQWNLPMIGTLQGWDITRGSEDTIVAVVDTGIDLYHPDLQANLLEGIDTTTQNSSLPMDDVGHGTHVAGIISALVNNREGVAGMSWHNSLLPVKVLDASGSGSTYAVAQGIIWATDQGAKVINMSLGNYADAQFLHDAIIYAFERDVVLIAASGNDNTERPGYPAAYDEVLAVAAVDSSGNKASFSNYGDYIDVAAPGVSIPSTYPNNQYAAMSGTSMACPHVSALAALIRSANPLLKNTEVMDIIMRTATDIGQQGRDQYYGYGLINVAQGLQMADQSLYSISLVPEWLKREITQIGETYNRSEATH